MSYISFISDEHLLKCIEKLFNEYEKTKKQFTEKKFYENQVDPIKLLFDIKFFGIKNEEKVLEEVKRKIDKTITNAIGHFHEDLIDGIEGYKKHPAGNGFDISDNEEKKLFADIKNKHNTVTGTHLPSLYRKLEEYIKDKEGAKAYWVQIISSGNSFEEQWRYESKDKKTILDNPNVYKISADKFYEILTGRKNAFAELCEALPIAINDFLNGKTITMISDKNIEVYNGINERATENRLSFIEQIMQDTFKNYAGFKIEKGSKQQIRKMLVDEIGNGKENKYVDISNVLVNRQYTAVELFAGGGGLSLGLEEAGFNNIGLVEFDKYAASTLKKNRPKWNVIQGDVAKIAEKGIRNYIDKDIKVDLLSGGYPCQAFSYAGKKLGLEDVRGTMFYYYAKILEELMPKVFLVETVRGLVSHDKGKTLETMIDVFTEIGYNVEYKILKATDYGVAQKRERLIIIGTRKDLKNIEFKFPTPFGYIPTLRDALKDVPESEGYDYNEKEKKLFKLVPQGGRLIDLSEDILKEHMGENYKNRLSTRYKRASWDLPLSVLTPFMRKEINGCHPDKIRPFTIREYARIQSFPDDWEFEGSKNKVYEQIRNAVPVNLGKAIGLAIVDYLNNIEY